MIYCNQAQYSTCRSILCVIAFASVKYLSTLQEENWCFGYKDLLVSLAHCVQPVGPAALLYIIAVYHQDAVSQ